MSRYLPLKIILFNMYAEHFRIFNPGLDILSMCICRAWVLKSRNHSCQEPVRYLELSQNSGLKKIQIGKHVTCCISIPVHPF